MKVIIAGSRSIVDPILVYDSMIESGFEFDEIVSRLANGVDTIGAKIALELGITLKEFPVTPEEWKKQGKRAGILRNRRMGDYADAAICIWDGISPGTCDMIAYMDRLGKPCFIKKVTDKNV